MNLKINITEEEINNFTENVVTVETTSGTKTINVSNVLKNSVSKFTRLLSAFNNKETFFNCITFIKENIPDKIYDRIQLVSTKESDFIFETFRKLGIVAPKIWIDISQTYDDIRLPTPILKQVRMLSPSMQKMFIMYIINIAYSISCITKLSDLPETDPFTGFIIDNKTDSEFYDIFFTTNLFTFTKTTINVSDACSDDIEAIVDYFKTPAIACGTGIGRKVCFGTIHELSTNKNMYAAIIKINDNKRITVIYTKHSFKPILNPIADYIAVTDMEELTQLELTHDALFSDVLTNMPLNYGGIAVCKSSFVKNTLPKEDIGDIEIICHDENCLEEILNPGVDVAEPWFAEIVSAYLKTGYTVESFESSYIDSVIKTLETSGYKCTLTKSSGSITDSLKEQYASDEYAQQLYTQVLPYFDDFNLGEIAKLVPGFAKGDIYALMFTGASGTGKSTAARVLPYKCGIPYVSINFSVNIEECDIIGTMIPNALKKTADDPEFVWEDGILTKAIRNGYCAILEEINFARPGVLGKLNSLLDETRQIDLPNGEVLKAHPNFRVIATCNIMYEGTNRFNKALINRFESCIEFKDLDKTEAVNTIISRTGYKDRSKIETVYEAYNALKKYMTAQRLDTIVSMRQLLTMFKQGKYYKNANVAFQNIVVNSAFIEDEEHKEEFMQTVLAALPLNFKI